MSEGLNTPRIPVSGPWITDLEVSYVADAARNAWYADHNTYHARFERAFADYLGVQHCMALPSCTSAIHLALMALGVGSGDEVIVPDITWIASAAPVSYVGATPVFADVDPQTWCLTADSVEACITPQTRAIIPVDLYGSMPDWKAIIALADARGIPVIEDAAEAVGSRYAGKLAGSFGRAGVFSFHGSKTLTTGEGGLLATNDGDLYQRAAFLRDHGRPPGDRYFNNTEVAHKYKMSSLQAALGLAQLERVDTLVGRKREIFSWYRDLLGDLPGLQLNAEPPGVYNSYWMSTVVIDPRFGIGKLDLMEQLDHRGIDSRPFFSPLSSIPAYARTVEAERARRRNTVAYQISSRGVNLPSGLTLDRNQALRVATAVRSILQTHASCDVPKFR